MPETNLFPVNISTRRTAITFVVALAASALAGLTVAQAGEARVTLKSPTGETKTRPAGSSVKVTGSATIDGSLVIERLRAPYDGDWTEVKSLTVAAGKGFAFIADEQINTKYRAILTPEDEGTEQVSSVVGVWRKWPKSRYETRSFPGGFSSRITITFPSAAFPGGEDVFDLEDRKVVHYSRFLRPASMRQSYFLRRGTTYAYLVGRKQVFNYDTTSSARVRWWATTWWCMDFDETAPFGAIGDPSCPKARKLSLKRLREFSRATRD